MLKTLIVSAALVAGASTLAVADTTIQTGHSASADRPMHHHSMMRARKNRVTANGRCNGVSYGTGQRSCGTKTGGSAGGNPSRN